MADRIPDIRLVRYALASAEHGSFRRAAAALNVQHPVVSRGVRSLEHRLGAELFERGHSGIRATPVGDRFLVEAALGFDHLRRAMQSVEALQRGKEGDLTIGVSVPLNVLGDVLERFRAECNGVAVEIVESTCGDCSGSVQRRETDIAFVTKAPPNETVTSLHLRDERMVVVLPRTHPLVGARAIMLEELRKERFILSTGGVGPENADHIRRRMAKSGDDADIELHGVSQCNLVNMVATGFGVTIMVGPVPQSAPSEVVFVRLAGKHVVPIHAVWMEVNANPALRKLLNLIGRIVQVRPQR